MRAGRRGGGDRPAQPGPAGPRDDPGVGVQTGRLVVVDEDYQSFGLSGEIAATITDVDPGMLRAPIVRVANPDVPVPYARSLEHAVLPRQHRIEEAIRASVYR